MQQLHTLKDIEQAIATHPLVSLYIKAPICGVLLALSIQFRPSKRSKNQPIL